MRMDLVARFCNSVTMSTTLITGAGRGIGREFCRQYAASGWRVIAVVRDREAQAELAAHGIDARRLDVRDFSGIESLAASLQGEPIDVLIANAGIYEGPDQPLAAVDPDFWLDAFRVNTMAPLLFARAFRANVAASGERKAIAITSMLGSISRNDRPGHYPYRTSKAALNAAWRGLAIEAPELIAVLLRPGTVRTRMTGPDAPLTPEESVAHMRALIARLTPDDSGKFLDYTGEPTPW
jgi:NAD(P)-dependent dehydrogenase (short-subunit alcohol dehydrogenase family)